MKTVVSIVQSNYLPWKGYFDIIAASDVFVFMDNVQYTNRDWRNRNKIKTSNGMQWLTVPCGSNVSRLICEVEISDKQWQKKHFNSIYHAYSKAPYFGRYVEFLKTVYFEKSWRNLSDLNQYLTKTIAREFLSIETKLTDSGRFSNNLGSSQRLLEIVKANGGQVYLSGPAAKDYLDVSMFQRAGVEVQWMDYSNYPLYPQLHGEFQHQVTILDLLFHCGSNAREFLRHTK
ncbi:WbqC family protein [Planctobacterium marinum]|uniref:WbqC family protein n=1 Tax=Planctobacterium marinum TaxID=1631968 RepID=UPI001E56C518|nr:WbqC family protein [Planctobacterium marinum]MCC2606121.1 WbqC family protein [Planctobacterium marinum]